MLRRSFFQIMEEASLMGNLVRLSNYMLTSALAQHAMDMSSELLSSLQHDGSEKVTHSSDDRVYRDQPLQFEMHEAARIVARDSNPEPHPHASVQSMTELPWCAGQLLQCEGELLARGCGYQLQPR